MEKISTRAYLCHMSTARNDSFINALSGLMRPLVRTLIRRGVTAPAFYKLLKAVYVDVAHRDFRLEGQAPTDSRVSLLTGVHRKDVRDILSSDEASWLETHQKTATFSTVLSRWMTLPEYQTADETPRPLPRTSTNGLSFEGLVRAVNKDIRPRTVLDELLNQGLVSEGPDGMLSVAPDAKLGDTPDAHRLAFFASNLGDHIAAASENLAADQPPFYERAVFYNRLAPGSVDAVEERARGLAQAMLEDLNAQSAQLQQADGGQTDGLERYRLGVYFYREKADTDAHKAKDVPGDTED